MFYERKTGKSSLHVVFKTNIIGEVNDGLVNIVEADMENGAICRNNRIEG